MHRAEVFSTPRRLGRTSDNGTQFDELQASAKETGAGPASTCGVYVQLLTCWQTPGLIRWIHLEPGLPHHQHARLKV